MPQGPTLIKLYGCLAGPVMSQTRLPEANLAGHVFVVMKYKTKTKAHIERQWLYYCNYSTGSLNSSNNELNLLPVSPSSSKPVII